MKTITFYSYKGGVGRSLALVNIATRLVEFGKKVCVIDFDLEAPGLHLKFNLSKTILKKYKKGIVDYVYSFANEGVLQNNVKDYCIEKHILQNNNPLSLIKAGDIDSENYWKKLSSINWYKLIYENPNGLAFFLHLKESIRKEINPDFLLIDSRTGISEMSGITLSLLADEVVIVAANNKENLGGASRIIKSLNNPGNNILGTVPNINFVLSRIPFTEKSEDRNKEILLINKIKREYLAPHVNDVSVIHSDRELEEAEKINIAYEKDESSTQTSIDYLELFEKLTKNDLSENEIIRFKNIRLSERLIIQANNTDNNKKKIEFLSKAIELNKNNIDAYISRGEVYAEIGDYQSALIDIERALKIDKNFLPAIHDLTFILYKQTKYSEAEIQANLYLSLAPHDLEALHFKSAICAKTQRLEEAEKIDSKAINIYPEISSTYSNRGNTRRLMKKFNEALQDVFKALELDSENEQAVSTLAEIYAETGRIDEFYIHFENALKINIAYMKHSIKGEEIYSRFLTEDRFLNLLSKYEIYLDNDETYNFL